MPVQRRRICRVQSLPTIAEAHGAISSFPMPEIKGAPKEVAPFQISSNLAHSLIERDDLKTMRERRMGRRTKEEREARRKAKKEKRREKRKAEKNREKEIKEQAAKEKVSTPASKEDINKPSPPKEPVPEDKSKLSPRSENMKKLVKSPVSLDDAVKKRELMEAIKDTSTIPAPPFSRNSKTGAELADDIYQTGDLLLISDDDEMEISEELVIPEAILLKGKQIRPSPLETDEPNTTSSTTDSLLSERVGLNPNTVRNASHASVPMVYDKLDHKVNTTSCSKAAPIEACETNPIAAKGKLGVEKSELAVTGDGKKSSMPNKLDEDEGPDSSSLPHVSTHHDSTKKSSAAINDSSQTKTNDDDEESAWIAAEVERLLMAAEKDTTQDKISETVQKPSDPKLTTFATRTSGPSHRLSFAGSVEEIENRTTVEMPQVSADDDMKKRPATSDSSQTETHDDDDEEDAWVAAEVERLLMAAESRDPTVQNDEVIETVQNKPSNRKMMVFATKGPKCRRSSPTGSVDEMDETTVEISQSSSENDEDFDDLNHQLVVDEESDTNVYDSEYSEASNNANMERNMRRITIRRPSAAGQQRVYSDSSDDEEEDVSIPFDTSTRAPHPSMKDARGDRPMLGRQGSKSDLRKYRKGPQMFTTSAFGVVSLSNHHQQTSVVESSFIVDDEQVVSDDDFPLEDADDDDLLPKNMSINEERNDHEVALSEKSRSTEELSPYSNEGSEFIVEEKAEFHKGCCKVFVLLLVSGLAAVIFVIAVASAIDDPASKVQISPEDTIGEMKYDPPTAEECGIIESGGTLEGEDELFRLDFDLLMDVELEDGFSLSGDDDGPNDQLLLALQARMDKYLVPHLAGCDDVPRDRVLRGGQSEIQASSNNVRYVIANADASVHLDETRSCEVSTTFTNCYAVRLSLHLKLKGEEKNLPITQVIHQSLDEQNNNSLSRTLQLSAPFYDAIVLDIIPMELVSSITTTTTPTDSPSSAPTSFKSLTESPSTTMALTDSPSSAPTINRAPTESPSSLPSST